jgi:site-specific recombinase XerD
LIKLGNHEARSVAAQAKRLAAAWALIYLSEIFNHSSIAVTRRYLGIRQEQLKDIYMNL